MPRERYSSGNTSPTSNHEMGLRPRLKAATKRMTHAKGIQSNEAVGKAI